MTIFNSEGTQDSGSQPQLIQETTYDIDTVQTYKRKQTLFSRIIRRFGTFLVSLTVVFGMSYVEFGGIYHAFKKHGNTDGWVSVFVFPYAWFRSIEWFWHDDHAGIDWDIQIPYDLDAVFGVYEAFISKDNIKDVIEVKSDLGKIVDELSKRFSSYNEDKLLVIKRATGSYMLYGISIGKDGAKYLENFLEGRSNHFTFSKRTLLLEEGFLKISKQEAYINRSKEIIIDAMRHYEEASKKGFTDDQKRILEETLKSQYADTKYRTDKARLLYKDLFGEEMDLSILEN